MNWQLCSDAFRQFQFGSLAVLEADRCSKTDGQLDHWIADLELERIQPTIAAINLTR